MIQFLVFLMNFTICLTLVDLKTVDLKYQQMTDIDNILNQRDIYLEAELAKEVDDELLGYFKYVVREEGLTHPPEDWRQAKDMYENIVQLAES